jgi:hypothetical protein
VSLLTDIARRLIGVSSFQPVGPQAKSLPQLDDEMVEEIRMRLGGNLTQLPTTRLRWYLADLEAAIRMADAGDMLMAAQLWRAMRRDGVIVGHLATRASGLVRLPRTFMGDADMVAQLQAGNGTRPAYDEMVPPAEAGLMIQDGFGIGISVGELVPVEGRVDPILVRLEPEFLRYVWNEAQWYYRSVTGLIPINPGDGRWVLHIPGGRMQPWQFGIWQALGQAFITKQHALMQRANYGGKLANPARVIHSPPNASEPERRGMLARLAAWGVNNVFELPVGWEASLLESKGTGHEVWTEDEASADVAIKMAVAGQVVTSDGGSGFINGDLFKSIRSDLIQTDGDGWAHTVNTQILPAFVARRKGIEAALQMIATVRYETKPPQDAQREATVLQTVSDSIQKLGQAAAPYELRLDMPSVVSQFALPLIPGKPPEGVLPPPEPKADEPDPAAMKEEGLTP